ncbi:hypothetical protein MRX96_000464 [Rhipicephalus microplus]
MRFANPFVFILQFCLIQLYPASNGDTGWLSINGTALILNKRVLHVPGLLNGISPRKTTSAQLVEGNNQEVAPVILTMHEVEESSHRIRLHALSSRRWRMISQLVQSVVPVDAYPTKALKRLPTI